MRILDSMDLSLPNLTTEQQRLLTELERESLAINRQLNLFSKSSAEDYYRRHILHSLALATREFHAGATVVDWGTGGGYPGLPLAIIFPDTEFILVDSIAKKIRAVETIAQNIGLTNVRVWNGRAENFDGDAHYAVSRATAPLETLWKWTSSILTPLKAIPNAAWKPGLLALKGGDLSDEINTAQRRYSNLKVESFDLEPLLGDSYFDEKMILWVGV